MRTLIVYYSLEGNTAYAAERIAAALGIAALEAELILIDPKARPHEDNERKIDAFCNKLKNA